MARIRSIHPAICESEDMLGLPAEVERTFCRLWTHCDDEGRCKDNPRLIKAAIYPLDDSMTSAAIDNHLDELAARGLVVRYEAAGRRYLAVPSWGRWQHPQKKRPSDIPPPDDPAPAPLPADDGTATRPLREESGPVVGVGEGVGVGEPSSILSPSGRDTPVQTERTEEEAGSIANRALAVLARRDLARREASAGPVESIEGWLSAVRRTRITNGDRSTLARLAMEHPGLSADAVTDLFEAESTSDLDALAHGTRQPPSEPTGGGDTPNGYVPPGVSPSARCFRGCGGTVADHDPDCMEHPANKPRRVTA